MEGKPTATPTAGSNMKGSRWARAAVASMSTGMAGQIVLVISGIAVARMLSVHDRGVVAVITSPPEVDSHLCLS